MTVLSLLFLFLTSPAHADQIVDLEPSDIDAANFYAQCASVLQGKQVTVVSGTRSISIYGIGYQFQLMDRDHKSAGLQVRWHASGRVYDCTLGNWQ